MLQNNYSGKFTEELGDRRGVRVQEDATFEIFQNICQHVESEWACNPAENKYNEIASKCTVFPEFLDFPFVCFSILGSSWTVCLYLSVLFTTIALFVYLVILLFCLLLVLFILIINCLLFKLPMINIMQRISLPINLCNANISFPSLLLLPLANEPLWWLRQHTVAHYDGCQSHYDAGVKEDICFLSAELEDEGSQEENDSCACIYCGAKAFDVFISPEFAQVNVAHSPSTSACCTNDEETECHEGVRSSKSHKYHRQELYYVIDNKSDLSPIQVSDARNNHCCYSPS